MWQKPALVVFPDDALDLAGRDRLRARGGRCSRSWFAGGPVAADPIARSHSQSSRRPAGVGLVEMIFDYPCYIMYELSRISDGGTALRRESPASSGLVTVSVLGLTASTAPQLSAVACPDAVRG